MSQRRRKHDDNKRSLKSNKNDSETLDEFLKTPKQSFHVSLFCAIIVFLITFACQMVEMYQDVPGGDSGEMIAESCLLGIAHPPGYPLYILVNGIAIRFLSSFAIHLSPAIIANTISVLFGSITSVFVSLTVLNMLYSNNGRIYAAICSGLCFSFAPLIWTYTIGTEVFALNNCICSILIYLTNRIRSETQSHKRVQLTAVGALMCGLGMSNQHTCILFEIPLILYILWLHYQNQLRIQDLFQYGASFVIGCLPYMHFLVKVATPGSWGDTSSMQGLIKHVMRSEYGTLSLSPKKASEDIESMMQRNIEYLMDLSTEQVPYGLAIFALVGLWQSLSQETQFGRVLFGVWIFYFGVFHSLANLSLHHAMPREVHRRFWIQPHLIVSIWFGLGIAALFRKFDSRSHAAIAIACASLLGFHAFQESMKMQTDLVGNYADLLIGSVPDQSLMLSHTDINWNSVRYKQACESKRPSLVHLSLQMIPFPWFQVTQSKLYPMVVFPSIRPGASTDRSSASNAQMIVDLIRANRDREEFRGGIYLDMHAINDADIGDENQYFQQKDLYLVPYGFVWKVEKLPQQNILEWNQRSGEIQNRTTMMIHSPSFQHEGSWEQVVLNIKYDGIYQRGVFLLVNGLKLLAAGNTSCLFVFEESCHAFELVVDMIDLHDTHHKTPTISSPLEDVMRNAALAGFRRLQVSQKIEDPSKTRLFITQVKKSMLGFMKYGSQKDSFYQSISKVLETLS